jgi:Rod binding domain-containing protein
MTTLLCQQLSQQTQMSASSGIGVAPELVEQFSAATSNNIRALKVSINNGKLLGSSTSQQKSI